MSEVAAELAASDPGHGYTLVELGATFSPAEGERIRQAWLMVRLSSSSSDGGQGSAAGAGVPASGSPIAWSMTPDRLATPLTQSRGVEVGADLQIVSVGINASRSAEGQEVWLEALNVRRADPVWEFTRTSTTPVYGAHLLTLMVRAPAGVAVRGRLSVLASIQRRHLKVFPYRVLLGDAADGEEFAIA